MWAFISSMLSSGWYAELPEVLELIGELALNVKPMPTSLNPHTFKSESTLRGSAIGVEGRATLYVAYICVSFIVCFFTFK
mgnify:CR=1 FL=1